MVVGAVSTSTDKNPKCLFFCDRYACGHHCVPGQVTRCVAAVMALPTLRLFPVTVVTVLVAVVSSSGDHEWHFNPGRMWYTHMQQRELNWWWTCAFLSYFDFDCKLKKRKEKKTATFETAWHDCIFNLLASSSPLLLMSICTAIVGPAAPTFSSHSQISKALSPSAINRLSCVLSLSASQSCVIGEWDSWAGSSRPLMHKQLMKVSVKMSEGSTWGASKLEPTRFNQRRLFLTAAARLWMRLFRDLSARREAV